MRTRPSTSKWFFRLKKPMMSSARMVTKRQRQTVAQKKPRAMMSKFKASFSSALKGVRLGISIGKA